MVSKRYVIVSVGEIKLRPLSDVPPTTLDINAKYQLVTRRDKAPPTRLQQIYKQTRSIKVSAGNLFTPSLISLMVSVDVKHHVLVWRWLRPLSDVPPTNL